MMDEARALEALRDILARPEFRDEGYVNPWEVLWAALVELLIDLLNALFVPVGEDAAGQGDWVRVAVVLVAVAVLLGAALFVARTAGVTMVRDASAGERAARERRASGARVRTGSGGRRTTWPRPAGWRRRYGPSTCPHCMPWRSTTSCAWRRR
jgi:hypothetical protein